MTEKEMRKLKKGDLLEIIYQLKRQTENLSKELEETKTRLEETQSVAQSVSKLNEMIQALQKNTEEES